MTLTSHTNGRRPLRPGQELHLPDTSYLWRVRQGVVGVVLDLASGAGCPQFLALAGDLIGADALAGEAPPGRVFAVTGAELEAVSCRGDAALRDALSLAYAQSRRQGREALRLRTGSVTERVKQMLLLLGVHGADPEEAEIELPSLRRLADILDASPESICRVLGRMRQLEVLVGRAPHRARVVKRALSDLVPPPGMSSSLRGYRFDPVQAR